MSDVSLVVLTPTHSSAVGDGEITNKHTTEKNTSRKKAKKGENFCTNKIYTHREKCQYVMDGLAFLRSAQDPSTVTRHTITLVNKH